MEIRRNSDELQGKTTIFTKSLPEKVDGVELFRKFSEICICFGSIFLSLRITVVFNEFCYVVLFCYTVYAWM